MFAILAVRGARWAYALFVGLALLYFPQKGGFIFEAPDCSWAFSADPFATAATNYPHIVLFALFFLITYAHFARSRMGTWSPLLVSAVITVVMSVLIEVAQGATNTGNCEVRDLIPDVGGLAIGAIVVLLVKAGQERWRAVVPVTDRDD